LGLFSSSLPHIRCDGTDICDAADIGEQSAANASFRWHQPSQPPDKNVDSAASAERPASHFGGFTAQIAKKLRIEENKKSA